MKKLPSILLLGLAAAAWADTDVDNTYFHPAASLYIHGDSTSASNLVAKGLSLFPDDGKLKRLKELLEQQQQQNQNEQQQDQQQDQQQQDQQQQDQQQDQQQPDQAEQPDQQQPDQAEQPDQQQQTEPQRAEQMSQDEAERLLDAMKQEEKNKRLELHPVMGRPVKVDRDW
jgi:Ca-activated chloride channel family protein